MRVRKQFLILAGVKKLHFTRTITGRIPVEQI